MEGGVLARPIGPAKRGTSSFALYDEKRGLKSFFLSLLPGWSVGAAAATLFGVRLGVGAGRRGGGALEQKLVTGNGGEGRKRREKKRILKLEEERGVEGGKVSSSPFPAFFLTRYFTTRNRPTKQIVVAEKREEQAVRGNHKLPRCAPYPSLYSLLVLAPDIRQGNAFVERESSTKTKANLCRLCTIRVKELIVV